MTYKMHVYGPDDITEHKSELEALREANAINKLYLRHRERHGEDATIMIATVSEAKTEISNIF